MMRLPLVFGSLAVLGLALFLVGQASEPSAAGTATVEKSATLPAGMAEATFAGGCFWCMEPPFDALDGVLSTTSGYTGGRVDNPTYEQVSSGRTGHLESVQVVYDPKKVDYETLLDVFWHNVDPTDSGGQFCDRGEQYGTAIFVHNEEQRQQAEASKQALIDHKTLRKPIVTPIRDATDFYPAEEYHQDYYEKNPIRYNFYRRGCGRDGVLKRLWGKAPH